MPPRRPLFAVSVVTLCVALTALQLAVLPWVLCLSAISALCCATLCWLAGWSAAVRTLAAVGLGLLVVARLEWAPPPATAITGQPSRVSGTVITSRETPTGGWIVVSGEADLRSAPACACTVIVRLRHGIERPPTWSAVIVTGLARPPGTTVSASDQMEQSWCQSRAAVFLVEADRCVIVREPPPWTHAILRVREWFSARLDHLYTEHTAATLQGMLLGDRTAIDPEHRKAYARTGTAHLFAVSGMHVGLILVVAVAALGGRIGTWWQWLVVVGVVASFVVITGGEPPAIRAGLVASVAALGRLRQRSVDPLNVLGLALMVELICWPTLILRPAFILSSVVTVAILWWVPAWQRCFERCTIRRKAWKRVVGTMVSIHLAASAGAAIPTAIYFGSVGVLAPLVNLVAVPLLSAALVITVMIIPVDLILPSVGFLMAWVVEVAVRASTEVILIADRCVPTIPAIAAPLVAVATLIHLTWPIQSSDGRGLTTRLVVGSLLIVVILAFHAEPRYGVVAYRKGTVAVVEVVSGQEHRSVTVGHRYGRPFVRSYHAQDRTSAR